MHIIQRMVWDWHLKHILDRSFRFHSLFHNYIFYLTFLVCRNGVRLTYDTRTNMALFRSFSASDYVAAQCLRWAKTIARKQLVWMKCLISAMSELKACLGCLVISYDFSSSVLISLLSHSHGKDFKFFFGWETRVKKMANYYGVANLSHSKPLLFFFGRREM